MCPLPRQMVKAGDGYRIIGPGIGGTGVVTINALLATAAWIDGLSVATLDQTGTAQKGGAVVSHLLLSEQPIEAPAKVNYGERRSDSWIRSAGRRQAPIISTARIPPALSQSSTPPKSPPAMSSAAGLCCTGRRELVDIIDACTRKGRNIYVDANRIAEGALCQPSGCQCVSPRRRLPGRFNPCFAQTRWMKRFA